MKIIVWVVIVLIGIVRLGIWWHFSLCGRIDARMYKAQSEERQTLMDIQRDIDQDKAACQGFFF